MNNRDRKNNKSSTISVGIIVIAVLLMEAITSAAVGGGDIIGIIAVVLFVGILGFAVALALAKKKGVAKHGSMYHAERAKEKARHIFMREEFDEEAVKCTHPRGRDKYIHQLDNFLANGIIDKSEYRVLKERYDKLNIPENMH